MLNDRIVIRRAGAEDLPQCLAIRHDVFVEEQGVPLSVERDGRDAVAYHFIARYAGEAVGTARVLVRDCHTAKVGRVAVLAHARGRGIGEALLRAILDEPSLHAVTRFELHAQKHATAFYERLGYRCFGEPFVEAAMLHIAMVLDRTSN